MEYKDLKDYLEMVKELEITKYEQEQADKLFQDKLKNLTSIVEEDLSEYKPKYPSEPVKPYTSVRWRAEEYYPVHELLAYGLFKNIPIFFRNVINHKKIKEAWDKDLEISRIEWDKYSQAKEQYEIQKVQYEQKKKDYTSLKDKCYDKIQSEIGQAQLENKTHRVQTQDLLQSYYSLDIVHPKYRTLAAICSLYEYIETGRCNTLEGSDGAYNKYEEELRLDRIVTQLDDIKDKLNTIQVNQFTLFTGLNKITEELKCLNKSISLNTDQLTNQLQFGQQIMGNILDKTSLIDYFSRITAFNTMAQENAVRFGILSGLTKTSVSLNRPK